jgi:fructose-1,6-bisphosphatase/inositol monophosphatase family enzyme
MNKMIDMVETLCQRAGAELMNQFSNFKITRAGRNPQTSADVFSNSIILEYIKKRYPHDLVISEEFGISSIAPRNFKQTRTWVVDPCDGTANFISGIPFYCVSIAILDSDNQIVLGVVFNPISNELFSAAKGLGAFLNGTRIFVSNETNIGNATVGIDIGHDPILIEQETQIIKKIGPNVRVIRSFYSGALELCFVACSRIDIRIDDSYKIWDVAAGALIASEAGARITNLKGQPWSPFDKSRTLVAANPILTDKVIAMIHKND